MGDRICTRWINLGWENGCWSEGGETSTPQWIASMSEIFVLGENEADLGWMRHEKLYPDKPGTEQHYMSIFGTKCAPFRGTFCYSTFVFRLDNSHQPRKPIITILKIPSGAGLANNLLLKVSELFCRIAHPKAFPMPCITTDVQTVPLALRSCP